MHDSNLAYKPYHKHLSKESFPEFMRAVASHIARKTKLTMLKIPKGDSFASLSGIYLHDGTSFSLNPRLQKSYPGRFKGKGGDAAVELHTTMDLLSDGIVRVYIDPDKESENHYRPEASELQNSLFIMDRYYFDLSYFEEMDYFGNYYIVRGRKTHNPEIWNAYTAKGKALRKFSQCKLNEIRHELSKRVMLDLDVVYRESDAEVRTIIFWHKKKKEFVYLATNLPRDKFTAGGCCCWISFTLAGRAII